MIFDPGSGVVLLSGGAESGVSGVRKHYGDLWSWDGRVWKKLGEAGMPRNAHSLAYDPVGKRVLMHGGMLATGRGIQGPYTEYGDVHELKGGKWKLLGEAPSARMMGPALGFDPARRRLVAFGRGIAESGGTFEFDGSKWEKAADQGPVGLVGFGAATNGAGELLLVGGFDESGPKTNTWLLKQGKWRKASSSPESLEASCVAFDAKRKRYVLIGGTKADGSHSKQTWAFDGSSWKVLDTAGPGPFDMPAMAYDAKRDRIVLVGATLRLPAKTETWEWDGRKWEKKN
jgi:hypothetical protein